MKKKILKITLSVVLILICIERFDMWVIYFMQRLA